MTETTVTPTKPLVVEEQETKPGWAGQSVPRKEDKRLVQGQGLFFDDDRLCGSDRGLGHASDTALIASKMFQ